MPSAKYTALLNSYHLFQSTVVKHAQHDSPREVQGVPTRCLVATVLCRSQYRLLAHLEDGQQQLLVVTSSF